MYRLAHHHVSLTDAQVKQIADEISYDQCSAQPTMTACTQAAFDSVIDQCLEWFGHLDTPGECPICHLSGWIAADRHVACHAQIMAEAHGLCRCGKPATDTYRWRAICAKCKDHEDHLDRLAD